MKYRFVHYALYCHLLAVVALVSTVGCGGSEGPKLITVKGKVTYKEKVLENAKVTYFPLAGTEGIGGSGTTDGEGNYTIQYGRGGDGLPAGEYKVTVSKRVMPDGSAPPEDVDPIESPARERMPGKYSQEENSQLKKTVADNGGPYDFDLK